MHPTHKMTPTSLHVNPEARAQTAPRARRRLFPLAALVLLVPLAAPQIRAQQSAESKNLIQQTVQTELASDRSDHTAFQYYDHDVTPDHDTLFYTVETPQGVLKRKIDDHGKPLNAEERRGDDLRLHALAADRNAQIKLQKDSQHDDSQAEQMLELLPNAFLWSFAEERGDLIELNFKPDPAYVPDTMESRVFAAMAGQVVVNRREKRIYTIRGTLIQDVKFGFGIFGRLKQGGTFEVERREVVAGHWQMTESHVHLVGKALFFKTIGSQEDETRFDFQIAEAKTMQQAYDALMAHGVAVP
jgi:hypothetical protein